MSDARRYRFEQSGFDIAVSIFPRGEPLPGIDVIVGTPWFTIGGYAHA